jgi:hypothetical protein
LATIVKAIPEVLTFRLTLRTGLVPELKVKRYLAGSRGLEDRTKEVVPSSKVVLELSKIRVEEFGPRVKDSEPGLSTGMALLDLFQSTNFKEGFEFEVKSA